jgi:hypothetical protein
MRLRFRISLLGVLLFAALPLSSQHAFAQPPADANCLGEDVSGVAQLINGLGFVIVRNEAPMNDNVLFHLQGDETKEPTTCPDDGFPTPLP